jgi:TolB-like protein
VWAFGCVLYECLTGRQAFQGGTVSDVIARILEREPEWGAIPGATPTRLRDLVRRCLTKEAANRPRDIGDLRGELVAIAADLSASGAATAIGSPGVGAGSPSLAVLYFENISSDAESDYFCAGITEDILTDLSKIKGMRVASRNAVARYRGAPADIVRVASELGVSAVLEGSVRRAGDRVRISAQLINAADGFHLWAERYDRTLQDVFAVQEEIASSIASALRVALTPVESESLVQDRPRDVRAYDLYLKARQYYGRYTPEGIRYALELFRQATQVDAEYARAFAGIADCYGQMLQWRTADDPDELKRLGLEAARRAIALSPRLAEAHKAEGLVLKFSGDVARSRSALVRALQHDSRFTPALINLAVDAFSRADLAATERLIRRAVEVDPQDAFATTWLGFLSLVTDRHDDVMALTQRLQRLSSDVFYITGTYGLRAMSHLWRNDLAAAERDVREGRAEGAEPSNMLVYEAAIAAHAGRTEEAKNTLAGLENVSTLTLGSGTLVTAAGAAVRVGEMERAAGFLGRRIVVDLAPMFVRLDPGLHALLDREPFAPRCWDTALVWVQEAPAIDETRRALFREIRLESGLPRGSDVLSGTA